ncbi:hypothetical protein OAD84_03335 [Pelagibacterales bacterium]|nr:hypothetical protein [Pelagibacterales bacterium]
MSRPIKPSPVTTTVSPTVGFTSRIPCIAIAPKTVKAAVSSSTSEGIDATRFLGTRTTSA